MIIERLCKVHNIEKVRGYVDASLRVGWICPECAKLSAYHTALREIQRIAADGIEANPEHSDNWNLFADIHQLACREMASKSASKNEAARARDQGEK